MSSLDNYWILTAIVDHHLSAVRSLSMRILWLISYNPCQRLDTELPGVLSTMTKSLPRGKDWLSLRHSSIQETTLSGVLVLWRRESANNLLITSKTVHAHWIKWEGKQKSRWKFITGLVPRQYRIRICSTGMILA